MAFDILEGKTLYVDSTYSGSSSANAHNGVMNNYWRSANSAYPHWIAVDLGAGVTKTVTKMFLSSWRSGDNIMLKEYILQGSNNSTDGSDGDWTNLLDSQCTNSFALQEFNVTNSTAYRWYRLYIESAWATGDNSCGVSLIELFEDGYKNVMPLMTADNAPSPYVVSANFAMNSGNAVFEAFNAVYNAYTDALISASGTLYGIVTIDLGSGNEVAVSGYQIMPYWQYGITRAPKTWTFEGSNNGTDWTTLDSQADITTWAEYTFKDYSFSNATAYRYYRLNCTANNGSTEYYGFGYLRMFGSFPTAQTLTPSGITSAQAFGSATVANSSAAQNLAPSGIASAEAIGSATVTVGAVTIAPSAIASSEAIGGTRINLNINSPPGIASSEAFGTAAIGCGAVTLAPTGIASVEAVGTVILTPGAISISPTGIISGGVVWMGGPVVSTGAISVTPSGITSGEAIGSLVLSSGSTNVLAAGIASGETFGEPVVSVGVASITPAGISSAQALGTPVLLCGAITISPTGIASTQAIGAPVCTAGTVNISPAGIASSEQVGAITVTPGGTSIAPAGIESAEGIGTAKVGLNITASGIASGEAIGGPVVEQWLVLRPTGIASGEAFGTIELVNPNYLHIQTVTLEIVQRTTTLTAQQRTTTLAVIERAVILEVDD